MAGSFTLTLYGTLVNGEHSESFGTSTKSTIVQTGQGVQGSTVAVGTSEEVMVTGDITTEGILYLKNLDSTHYVTYGPESAGSLVNFGRIPAGEEAWLRLEPGITFRWIANTAEVKVLMKLFED